MRLKNNSSRRSYNREIHRAHSSRTVNAILCAICIVLCLGEAVYAWLYAPDIRLAAAAAALSLSLLLSQLMIKSIREAKAVKLIGASGKYASMLTAYQQETIRDQQQRLGSITYFKVFAVFLACEMTVLTIFYIIFKNAAFLLLMASLSLFAFFITLIAAMFLSARLVTRDAFFTISGDGILSSGEVLPFDAKKGEALSLEEYPDFYRLRFVKTMIFGIKYTSSIIFPTDGALKKGVDGSVCEVLRIMLRLPEVMHFSYPYSEKRDEVLFSDYVKACANNENAPTAPTEEELEAEAEAKEATPGGFENTMEFASINRILSELENNEPASAVK
ncbi:MAG: hypothetical protein RR058_08065 [Oscillospiraceae bacterium]